MGTILIGTCSWTDKTLIDSGKFYPPEVKTPEERLRFYASQFRIVEVDSTYYAMPSQRVAALWAERTPPGFLFHIKAFSLFTGHPTPLRVLPKERRDLLPPEVQAKERIYLKDLQPAAQEEAWRYFREALLPLDSAGKLGLVLFQFPPWFMPRHESREHILTCQSQLPQYRLAIEFRNSLWLTKRDQERTLAFLRDHGLALVCVDEPQGFRSSVPPLAVATTDQAYVRFHGRNRETWEKKGSAAWERFNHWYSDEELQEWVPRLRALQEQAKATHVLFNTNYQDQGMVNAQKLAGLLEQQP